MSIPKRVLMSFLFTPFFIATLIAQVAFNVLFCLSLAKNKKAGRQQTSAGQSSHNVMKMVTEIATRDKPFLLVLCSRLDSKVQSTQGLPQSPRQPHFTQGFILTPGFQPDSTFRL